MSWVNKSQVACNQVENFVSVFRFLLLCSIKFCVSHGFSLWIMRESLIWWWEFVDLASRIKFQYVDLYFLKNFLDNFKTISNPNSKLTTSISTNSSPSTRFFNFRPSKNKLHLTLFNLHRFVWQWANVCWRTSKKQ